MLHRLIRSQSNKSVTGLRAVVPLAAFSKRRAAIAAATAIAIGLVVSFTFASDQLATSTDANTVLIQYSLPHVLMPVSSGNLPMSSTPPFTLYGNGLLVCGHDSSMPFMSMPMGANPAPAALPTSTYLTQTQIHTLVQQISDTGFLNLKKEYFAYPVAEQEDVLRVNLLTGNHYVLYYNDVPAPAAYTNTLTALENYCKTTITPYQAPQVTLRVLKNPSPTSQSVQNISALSSTIAPTVQLSLPGA